DNRFTGSSGTLTGGQAVNQASTNTIVISSGSPSVFGQAVSFTAAISVQSPGAGTPTGTVQFQIHGLNAGSPVSVSTSGGLTTASFGTATLAVGAHAITASYNGDDSFATSIGSVFGGQTVYKASTAVLVSSSVNPSVRGQSVTFTATINVMAP